MSRRALSVALALAATASTLALAAPATAAPAAPSSVTVTRTTRGYNVKWTAVSGADAYTVRVEAPVGSKTSGNGYMVTSFAMRPLATLAGNVTSYSAPDDFFSNNFVTAPRSPRFYVAARSGNTSSNFTSGFSRCAEGYYVAARGSGQNPQNSTSQYSSGMGNRGKAVYEDLRIRLKLSRSYFQPIGVNYPAVAVNDTQAAFATSTKTQAYIDSVRIGTENMRLAVQRIVSGCPSAHIHMFGYSQGAQVAGNAFTNITAVQRARVDALVLFADPKRNSDDRNTLARPYSLTYSGPLGKRAVMPKAFTGQAASWCWKADLVCVRGGYKFHGDAYTCYQTHAAAEMVTNSSRRDFRKGLSDRRAATCPTQ